MEKQENIKAMSKTELANAYGVSIISFNNWIKPFRKQIGDYRGKCYTPKQVSKIFELLGIP